MDSAVNDAFPRSRNPKACESCRTNKSRCLASECPDVCQRCLKSQTKCVVRAVARPRRSRGADVPHVESGTDSGRFRNENDSETTVYLRLPAIILPSTDNFNAVLEGHHEDSFRQILPPDEHEEFQPTAALSDCSDAVAAPDFVRGKALAEERLIDQRNLSIDQAEELLRSFRYMYSYFPFVIVHPKATVQSLSQTSPFLLLAILASASTTDFQLHHQLDHEFKRVLSAKVVIEGQKSLDFLQGLLVYTAWYPSHIHPRNRQGSLSVSLAISLTIDLGLNQSRPPSSFRLQGVSTNGLLDAESFSNAAKRAYLGCYYLSSAMALVLHGPNSLKYSDVIDEYGISLAREAEVPTDMSLLPLVRAQRFREEIRDALYPPCSKFLLFHFSPELHIQNFQGELEEWEKSLPYKIKTSPLVILTTRYLHIILYCYDHVYFRQSAVLKGQQYNNGHLTICLEAVKKYFEYLLSIPVTEYAAFTTALWSMMVQAIIVLSQLLFPISSCPSWDVAFAREYAPLGMYLDCLCYRMQDLSSTLSVQGEKLKNPDGAFVFKMILESIKKTYEKHIALPITQLDISAERVIPTSDQRSNLAGSVGLRCPMRDPSLKAYLDTVRPPAGDSLPSSAASPPNVPLYHDLWATMTMSWGST